MSCLYILKVHFAFLKWNKDAERTQKDFDPFESYFIIPYIKTSKLRTRLKTNSRLNSRLRAYSTSQSRALGKPCEVSESLADIPLDVYMSI